MQARCRDHLDCVLTSIPSYRFEVVMVSFAEATYSFVEADGTVAVQIVLLVEVAQSVTVEVTGGKLYV